MRKEILMRLLAVMSLVAGMSFHAVPAAAQRDTILVRTGEIDIRGGVLRPKADTVVLDAPSETTVQLVPRTDSLPKLADSLLNLPSRIPLVGELVAEGDRLREGYRFADAMAVYQQAMERIPDPQERLAVEDRFIQAQNGRNMTDYCSTPVTVARERFSLEDFFLFYPLKGSSWRKTPNQLDSTAAGGPVSATYVPKDEKTVYFSAADGAGLRNIYVTRDEDTLWTAPALLGERLLSSRNEIYPMLSPDGRTLYFASDGLYGMGGYDLYASSWDDVSGEWGEPVNLGFPYSSPADDFLLMNTEDGRYTIFASNRDCSRDSVYVYVLEYEAVPVRKSIHDIEQLRNLSALVPVRDLQRMDNASAVSGSMPDTDGTKRYMEKMAEVRALRDSIYRYEKELDAKRLALGRLPEDGRADIAAEISEKEAALQPLRQALNAAGKEVQALEMEFLSGGIVPDAGNVRRTADREVVGASAGYTFTKHSMGPRLKIDIARPEPAMDYAFKVMPVGRFAPDSTLPEGIVYQIRIFTASSHATLDDIRGLSPVFERLTSSLKYTYSAGVFRTYADALSHLNEVRRLGFRDAAIQAFRDGRPISVSAARKLE